MSNSNNPQPSTSGLNNGSTSAVGSPSNLSNTTNKTDMPSNSRFKCARCGQHSLVLNKPVYYLPCLHLLCHGCYDKVRNGQPNHPTVFCPTCKTETPRESIFDDFTYDPNRKRCEIDNCENQKPDKVFSKCITCNKFLCERHATEHEASHKLRDSSTYIPLTSRCSTQHTPNRFAAYICGCRRYLCVNCAQTHQCNTMALTEISHLIRQSVEYMSKISEADRRTFLHYQKIYDGIQSRRRQIVAEFHNARSSLAHSSTKAASIMIHRYTDIGQHLNTLQNSVLSQLSTHEKMIAMEMQKIKDVIGLENQIKTTEQHNAIPFFSFVKAASVNAAQSCKHQSYNVDQQIPMLNVRIDTKLPDLCTFLNGFGSVQINGAVTRPKSKFDNSTIPMFDVVPKINPLDTTRSMGYSLKILNGSKHVVVDKEEIKRRVKRIQDPDELRERCEQLENEVAYFKALSNHLESELQNRRIPDIPCSSKQNSTQVNQSATSSSNKTSTPWANPNNPQTRPTLTLQQQQLIHQFRQSQVMPNPGVPVQRVSNNSRRYQGPATMAGYHENNHNHNPFQNHHHHSAHGHSSLPHGSSQYPVPNLQMPTSTPGSPQYNSRLGSKNVQSPVTPNAMFPPNMMFHRPPHMNPQEWQMHCMQQFRQRAPNPQLMNNALINELMRNSLSQLSPNSAAPHNQPLNHIPSPQHQISMQSPPQQFGISRSGSISGLADVLRINSVENAESQASKNPVEIVISDDEEDQIKQKNITDQVQPQSTNGNSVEEVTPSSSNNQLVTEPPVSNNSSSNENTEVKTPQSDAFTRSFRFTSVDNVLQETRNVDNNSRASSVPQNNATPEITQPTSTDQGAASSNISESLNNSKEAPVEVEVKKPPKEPEKPPKEPEKPPKEPEKPPKEPEKPIEAEPHVNPPIKLRIRVDGNNQYTKTTAHSIPTEPGPARSETNPRREADNTEDAWDDFCYVCNEGCDEKSGDLGCCATCPKVFHQYCHIPYCTKPMQDLPDDWQCNSCVEIEPIREVINDFPEKALLACSRVLLLCFKDAQKVEPFRRAEFSQEAEFHINLFKIATRLSKKSYKTVSDFLNDMNTLFMNCSRYAAPTSVLADYGRSLYKMYQDAVRDFLPAYAKKLWMYVNLYDKSDVPKKKRRVE